MTKTFTERDAAAAAAPYVAPTAAASAPYSTAPLPSPSTNRPNLYAEIHKAMRAVLCETLVTVGRTDAFDAAEVASTLAAVRELLDHCRGHLDKENEYLHPALEAVEPGTSARIAGEHDEHLQAIADLDEDVAVVEAATDAGRDAALFTLYQRLSLFVAENLAHMMVEETRHNATLWAHYGDDELDAIHDRILASIAPPEMMRILRWMAPSVTPASRAAMFGGMRAAMPPPVFVGIVEFAKSHLDAFDAAKLDRDLALAA